MKLRLELRLKLRLKLKLKITSSTPSSLSTDNHATSAVYFKVSTKKLGI
ncbi:MAG: hypothetical protein M5F18_07440 [Asgard group archaeon]|nr:hypothetical protein [Asgard group archaeon]